jgi:hypothetical protein
VTLGLGDYKAGAHSQRGEDLKHVGIKADGVTEHYFVSVGCRRKKKKKKKKYKRKFRKLL